MIKLDKKIDFSSGESGKLYSAEANLVFDSLKNTILAGGDQRPGDTNTYALVGAIDDIAKKQLFYIDINNNLKRKVDINDDGNNEIFKLSEGMLFLISVVKDQVIPSTITINGTATAISINGDSSGTYTIPGDSIIFGLYIGGEIKGLYSYGVLRETDLTNILNNIQSNTNAITALAEAQIQNNAILLDTLNQHITATNTNTDNVI